ncbi:hypothetical protein CRE_29046 [Caenorhabditis remanei]|uniref:RNA-directed DNA polymerase n=1 Tax=Caenorhabditis remanei TaxID=31234 RepID=E3NA66_CAERE|nr:hypothetical protein CRE_29046 [Caenorhabditis remanei]
MRRATALWRRAHLNAEPVEKPTTTKATYNHLVATNRCHGRRHHRRYRSRIQPLPQPSAQLLQKSQHTWSDHTQEHPTESKVKERREKKKKREEEEEELRRRRVKKKKKKEEELRRRRRRVQKKEKKKIEKKKIEKKKIEKKKIEKKKIEKKKQLPRLPTAASDRVLRSHRNQKEDTPTLTAVQTPTPDTTPTTGQTSDSDRTLTAAQTPITTRTSTTVRTPRGFWNFLSDIFDQSIDVRTPRSSTPIPDHQSPRFEEEFPDLTIIGEEETEEEELSEEEEETAIQVEKQPESSEEESSVTSEFFTPNGSMSTLPEVKAGTGGGRPQPTTHEMPSWKRKGELARMMDPRIKKFSEGKSSDLHRWLKDYAKLVYRMDIPRETGTELLPFFLSGTALQKYNALDHKILDDWAKTTKQLMLAHDCPTDREISLQELTSVQQGKKTVSEFAAHIRELGEYVYEGLPEKNRDLLLASHFLTGCSKKIKSRLRQLQNIPKSLRAMTAEAEKIQRLLELEEEEEATEAVIAAVQQWNIGQQDRGNIDSGRGNFRGRGFQSRGDSQGYGSRGGFQGNSQRGGYREMNTNQEEAAHSEEATEDVAEETGTKDTVIKEPGTKETGTSNEATKEVTTPIPQGKDHQTKQHRTPRTAVESDGIPPLDAHSSSTASAKHALGIMMCLFPHKETLEATKTNLVDLREAGEHFRSHQQRTPCNFEQSHSHSRTYARQRLFDNGTKSNPRWKHHKWLQNMRVEREKIGKRIPVSVDECRKTSITKKFNEMELKEIAPGIYRSEKIGEAAENATRILGTTTFKTFEFTMEVGKVASLDGIHVMSTLASLEKCTFGAGFCQDDSSTVVWQPQETRRECQFELMQSSTAIISQQFIAIEEMAIFSKFDTDLRRLQDALEGCFIHQGYRTDDGYLIEFPEVQSKGWVPDMHIDDMTFGRRHNPWIRRSRETVTSLGPAGTEFQAYIGEPFITPIIRRLYGTANIEELTDLKSPITDPEILQEFGKYNVTNKLLADRARNYPKDRKHQNPMLLMSLKAIRVAQYGARQMKAMEKLNRPLTRGEEQLKLEIERQAAFTFDKLLGKEFGISEPDIRHPDEKFVPPKFEEKDLKPYRNLPAEEEPSWTTTTRKPATTLRNTSPPATSLKSTQPSTTTPKAPPIPVTPPRNTNPPATAPPRTAPRLKPTTPQSITRNRDRWEHDQDYQTPSREMSHIPEANRNVVYEPVAQPSFEEVEHQPSEERERPLIDQFEGICQEQWKSTTLFQTLLRIDPTAAIRQLLRRNDISAKIIGESLIISKCREVTPDVIHYGRKVNSTCYNLIPVTVKGKLWFQLPGSNDLIGEATEIACEDRPPSVRYEHNRWVGLENQEVLPQFLARPNGKLQEQFILPAPETFHTNLDEETGVSTGTDREMQYINDENSKKLRKRLITEGILKDTIEKVKETTAAAGKSAKNLYKSTMDSMKEGVKDVVFSVLMLVAWIVIPIALIALVVVILYGYCKYRAYRSAGRVAKRSAKRATDALVEYAHHHLVNNIQMQETNSYRPISRTVEEEYPIHSINSVRINSVTAARLPHIDVEAEGGKLEALLDSGAAISYMPVSSVKSKINTDRQPQARTANGSPIRFLGTCDTTVKMGNYQIPHTFLVSQDGDCPAAMLIGADMMEKINKLGHEVQINLYKKKLTIGECLININFVTEEMNEPVNVKIAEDVVVNARSEAVIPAELENYRVEMGNEFLVEDNQKDSFEIFVVARSLIRTDKKGRTRVQVLNPSRSKIQFKKGRRIGIAGKVDIVQPIWGADVSPEAHWEARLPKLPQDRPKNYKVSDKVDFSTTELTPEQKEDLIFVINFHEGAFVGPDGILGEYNGKIKHRIDLIDESKVPQGKVYRVPLEKRKEVETQLKEMIKQGIIRPTDSPFSAPIVLVRKADKTSWRFTVDFRALNALTQPVQSIIPNIHEILDLCAGKILYTTLDFQQGFHQIPVEPAHCARTAFACHMGAFEYIRMPMGLKGSPGTFQRVMNTLIKEIQARVFVYIDDMVLTSESPSQHVRDIEEVLDKIEKSGMKLRPEKCKFALPEIRYLGFIISKSGIHPDPEKTKAIDEYPTPKTVKEVRAFIGMASFYRRFIENFSKIAAPIMTLTKKDQPFEWTNECEEAFKELKAALTKNPILVAPKLGKPFVIEVDSSGKGVGAVLFQAQDDEGKDLRVIAYASRVYNGAEKRYPAIELEGLGLVYAVQQFRPYIDGARTLIITDHAPLKSLLHRKDLIGRMGKYQIVLQEYDIQIEYRPGKQNIVCDTLSRFHPRDEETAEADINAITDTAIDFAKVQQEQEADKRIRETKEMVQKFRVQSNVLFEKGAENKWMIRLPPETKYGKTLTRKIHASIFENAHLGSERTEKKVREVAIWQGMTKDIRRIVEGCTTCQKNKDTIQTRIQAKLGKFPEASAPFQRVHADYVGPLPETTRRNKYIAVFVCAFSKFIIAEPVIDQTAETLCNVFTDRVVSRFGAPKLLVTDRGTNFMSKKFEDLLTSINCAHNASTAYHHKANGQVERANQTIEMMLRQVKDKEEWDIDLQPLIHAYNNSVNSTTGIQPHRVIHGQQANSPVKNSIPEEEEKLENPSEYANRIEKEQPKRNQLCQENIRKKTQKQQESHDTRKNINDVTINIGDKVWIREKRFGKIAAQFIGPFQVIRVEDPNVIVEIPAMGTRANNRRTRVIHKNNCKRKTTRNRTTPESHILNEPSKEKVVDTTGCTGIQKTRETETSLFDQQRKQEQRKKGKTTRELIHLRSRGISWRRNEHGRLNGDITTTAHIQPVTEVSPEDPEDAEEEQDPWED